MATIDVKDAAGATQTIQQPNANGRGAASASRPVVLSTEDKTVLDALETKTGSLTETAPASDTASSGLNGRLQRIAQRLTSLIALVPASLGTKTAANSMSVVLASDQVVVPVQHAARTARGRQVTTITGTSETTIVSAGSSGVFRDLFMLLLTNSSSTATVVTIKDATAGTTVMTLAVPAGQTVGYTLPACDAVKQSSSANNWTATLGTGVTSLFVSAFYVEN